MFRIDIKIVAIALTVLYALMVIFFYDFYKHLVIKDAKQEVLTILNTTKAIRSYIENIQKPVIYKLKKERKLYSEFFDPRLMSSTFIANSIHNIYRKKSEAYNGFVPYKYKLAATNPRNPANLADDFERKILQKFRKKEIQEFSTFIKENGIEYFFVALPIDRNQKSCLKCHGNPKDAPKELINMYGDKAGFHEKVGDLRAIISIKVPITNIVSTHIKDFFITISIGFAVFVLIFVFLYIIYKNNQKLQKKRELLLMHQNKLASMGSMIENIAHQWKQPLSQLSFAMANLEIRMKKGILDEEKLKEKIDESKGQIQFMSNTIDDFRNFLSTQKDKEHYQVDDVIKLSYQLLSSSIDKNSIEFKKVIEENFKLYGYPNEMIQALINIIKNAIDILKLRKIKEPAITIKTYKKEGIKYIDIYDNGGGIDVEPVDKVFEPYFTTKSKGMGTGIGLYLAKIIIEKNGGQISVKNIHNEAHFIIKF